jgi:hypothetical protein
MKRNATPGVHEDFPYQVTMALLSFLQSAGLTRKAIEGLVTRSLADLEGRNARAKTVSQVDPGVATIVGAAFHVWFRSRKYLTDTGKPKPLKLLGPSDSVESLIAAESSSAPAARVASELLRLGLLRKVGQARYVPTALHSLIRGEHPYLSEHVAHSIIRFIDTVRKNSGSPTKNEPLIERFAHVSSLPKSKIREFKDFTNQQGEALIDTVNDWLEANKDDGSGAGKKRSPVDLQAGLHVFAYVGDREK